MDFIFDPSLVIYLPLYELNGNTFKSKDRYGHLGTVTGALWRGEGHFFDNTDDNILIPAFIGLPTGSAARTIEVWAKPNTKNNYPRFASYGENAQRNRWDFAIRGDNGKVAVFTTGDDVQSDSVLTLDTWHHVVASWDGSSLVFYIDAVTDGVRSFVGTPNTIASAVRIGAEIISAGNVFGGIMGEVRIYSRALTAVEIQNNYLATKWRYK